MKRVHGLKDILLITFVLCLSACGGGGGGSSPKAQASQPSIPPIANPDITTANRRNTVVIDALKNDNDSNPLAIISLGPLNNGTAKIKNNLIEYTPNANFFGNESFSYTIINSHGKTAVSTITVTVKNNVTISGKIIDLTTENQKITVTVGTSEYDGLSNKQGLFSILVSAENEDDLVAVFAENISNNYSLKSQLGSIEYILNNSDQQNNFNNANLSNISTAEYELLNKVNNNTPITSAQELAKSRFKINTNSVLKLAITAQLIQTYSELELPIGYSSINKLYNSPFVADKLLATWRSEHRTKFDNAYSSLFSKPIQTSMPTELLNKNSILKIPNLISSPFSSHTIQINDDKSGSYYINKDVGQTLTWDKAANALALILTNPLMTSVQESYYADLIDKASFCINQLSLTRLYSTASYQVYLTKAQGQLSSNNDCTILEDQLLDFNTVMIPKIQNINITPGRYYLEGAKRSTDSNKPANSYDRIAATFDFTDNGVFTSTINSTTKSQGKWQNINGTLELTYDGDDTKVIYQKYGQSNNLDLASFYVISEGRLVLAGDTLVVKKQEFKLDLSKGYLSGAQLPLFNPEINSNFGFQLNKIGIDNGIGSQLLHSKNHWYSLKQFQYLWTLEKNVFILKYVADFCFNGEEACQTKEWSRRELEVIGKTNDYYIIKSYMEYSDGRYVKRGYIKLFSYIDE